MRRLDIFSEPFSKTGNISADGFKRLLGCPAQDLLQTVLREAIQNSIDAARFGSGPSLLIRYRTLTPEQYSFLRECVLAHLPQGEQTRNDIVTSLGKKSLKVLEICDFNTTGLGGPSSGDVALDGGEVLDFVNFLRNVGVARDKYHGGGTYGYGKSALYAMSACSTIIIDSQTTYDEQPVRRFMGCHLGSAFDANTNDGKRKRFTGRHWWGVSDGDGGIDPLTRAPAAEMAVSLGMPARDEGSMGTSILILDPHIGDGNELGPLNNHFQETILWNFWPRLTASTPEEKKLHIQLEIEGCEIPLPTPEQFPPLDHFASAIAEYRKGCNVATISSEKPKKDLGSLVIVKGLCANRVGSPTERLSVIPRQSCHIALMRPVELVVKYIKGNPYSDNRFEWAGVFICSCEDEVESAFAMSEPPAHDDWIPDNLSDRKAKIYVRGALKRVEQAAYNYAEPVFKNTIGDSERTPSLAYTAAFLGRLLGPVSERGPGKPKSKTRITSKKHELSISFPRFVGLEIDQEKRRCAIFEAELKNDESDMSLYLQAESHLVVDGTISDDGGLPKGYKTMVISMSLVDTGEVVNDSVIKVGIVSGIVRIVVLSPPEAAVGVRLRFRHEDK